MSHHSHFYFFPPSYRPDHGRLFDAQRHHQTKPKRFRNLQFDNNHRTDHRHIRQSERLFITRTQIRLSDLRYDAHIPTRLHPAHPLTQQRDRSDARKGLHLPHLSQNPQFQFQFGPSRASPQRRKTFPLQTLRRHFHHQWKHAQTHANPHPLRIGRFGIQRDG